MGRSTIREVSREVMSEQFSPRGWACACMWGGWRERVWKTQGGGEAKELLAWNRRGKRQRGGHSGPSKKTPPRERKSLHLKPLEGLKEQREQRETLEGSQCYEVENGGKTANQSGSCCSEPGEVNTEAKWSKKNMMRPWFKQYFEEANVNKFCQLGNHVQRLLCIQ